MCNKRYRFARGLVRCVVCMVVCGALFGKPLAEAPAEEAQGIDSTALAGPVADVAGEDVIRDAPSDSVNVVGAEAATESQEGVRGEARQKLTETASRLGETFSPGKMIAALFVLISTYIAIRILAWAIALLANRFGQYRLKLMVLVPIVRILAWTGAIFVVTFGIFSPRIDALLAFSASAGIAIGFASQDILKNIFGGILIILDRPFQVGDKIQVGNHYGEVVNIGLRTVRLVTPDDSLVSVPNAELVNQSVSNANSGALDCQVVIEFHLSANADITRAKKIAYEAAATSRLVYLKKPVVVLVQDVYKRRFLTKLKVKAYVLDARYEAAFASDVSERAKAAFVAEGFYEETRAMDASF